MNSTKKTARFAGILYLVWIVTGMFALFYVPSKIMVPGDSVATAHNILAHEFLFRAYIFNDLISNAIWVVMALVFYRLFKPVNDRQAKLLVALVLVQVPVAFFMESFNIASLMILKGEVLKTFEFSQRQDVAMLFLKLNDYGAWTLELFWGLWLFPLAILVYRSRFLPGFLGIWLMVNGIACVILSATSLLMPEYKDTVYTISLPAMFGEVVFMLWLVIMGARKEPSLESAVASS